ncbi:MAG: response regulator transcription factor [Chloroflexi bacterium]|nr:response regulator transcription factor [Chloroflexota bacterium]
MVRQGLRVILKHEADLQVVGAAANGQQAVELTEQLSPNVVLMDLKMPMMNGIQATRAIIEKFPQTRVVVLTTFSADEWVFDALRAGACGYLLKDSDSADIVRAIRGAVNGEAMIDPSVAGHVLEEFNRLAANTPSMNFTAQAANLPPIEPLTERELAVLQHLANGKSNHEIAETLFLSEGTVKNYVSTIMSKLQANDRTQAAILALKRGLAKLE